VEGYAHHGGKVVVCGGWDLSAGAPDVLYGGVQVAQLQGDRTLVHWTTTTTAAGPSSYFLLIYLI